MGWPVFTVDVWDVLGFAGCALVLAGLAAIYWPAALILAGAGLLGVYYLRERALGADPIPARPEEPRPRGRGEQD